MKNSKSKIKVNFHKTYSVPREYLTGDEEYELQLIRKRLKRDIEKNMRLRNLKRKCYKE